MIYFFKLLKRIEVLHIKAIHAMAMVIRFEIICFFCKNRLCRLPTYSYMSYY